MPQMAMGSRADCAILLLSVAIGDIMASLI